LEISENTASAKLNIHTDKIGKGTWTEWLMKEYGNKFYSKNQKRR
jgi:hypothetical protein